MLPVNWAIPNEVGTLTMEILCNTGIGLDTILRRQSLSFLLSEI